TFISRDKSSRTIADRSAVLTVPVPAFGVAEREHVALPVGEVCSLLVAHTGVPLFDLHDSVTPFGRGFRGSGMSLRRSSSWMTSVTSSSLETITHWSFSFVYRATKVNAVPGSKCWEMAFRWPAIRAS